jgi:hypothetical protein
MLSPDRASHERHKQLEEAAQFRLTYDCDTCAAFSTLEVSLECQRERVGMLACFQLRTVDKNAYCELFHCLFSL